MDGIASRGIVAVRAIPKLGPRALGLIVLVVTMTALVPPARSETGGPDSYGYVWVDNRAPSPVVPFSWVDITSSGTRVALAADDCTFEISLGFQFRFYGILVDQIHVCSNGFLTFSLQTFGFEGPIPNASAPNDRIVALGMDLYPPTNGTAGVYVLSQPWTTPRKFIVTWNNVVAQYTPSRQTFQIVLEQNHTSRDGRILIQYQKLTGVMSPLIGIENRTGSSGLAYPFAPAEGLAIAFLPPSDASLPPDDLTVTPSVLAPGATAQGNRNVAMLQLDLTTASNDVFVSEIKAELSGLNAGAEDVPLASVWLDDGDGGFSSATDSLLSSSILQGSPPVARFRLFPSLSVGMGLSRRAYITYDIAPGAGVGDWVGARMEASSVSVEFPDRVAPFGFPVDTYVPSVRTRIDPSVDTLALVAFTDRVPGNGTQWETDLPAASLRFGVGSNIVELAGLTLGIGGNATGQDVWRVKALEDADGDASYSPGIDPVLDVAIPSGVPLAANLTFSRTIAAGTPVDFLILFDLGPEAVVGNGANFTLNVTGIHLAPGSADVRSPSNLPSTTGVVAIRPGVRPSLDAVWSPVPPSADGAWDVGEYVLGASNTDIFVPPAGNRVPGYLTVENNATMLYVAIDATGDGSSSPGDGVAIGFDTDRDGLPTDGADDVFVANASGGGRFVYSVPAGSWIPNAICAAVGGNDTTPACAAAFGATELSATGHRLYEFAIPLTLLGLTVPVGPGAVLRFGLGAPPHDGLASEAGRSTWPILFAPLPSLRHFADLHLTAAPIVNSPPTLDWTGEPGYVSDGLEPETGLRDDVFVWRIAYTDADEHAPAFSQPRLRVLRDGNPIPGSPFAMVEDDPADLLYADGKVYVQAVRLTVCGGNFTYEFTARDGLGGVALAVNGTGPVVGCPDLPPLLLLPNVSPPTGLSGTAFTFSIAYADPENRPPSYVQATVALNGSDMPAIPLSFDRWVGAPLDYATGAWYDGTVILVLEGTNYTFRFRTSDGNTTVDAGPFLGPVVVPQPPDTLLVAGGDLFPPFVSDEGTRLIEFLQLVLYTSDPEVNVTSLRFDQIGTAQDAEVDAVLLYDDRDESRRLSEGDVLLGSRPLLLGFAEFAVSLRVTPSNASSLILLANLTTPGTADRTVGFELSAAASIGVASGDTVASFAAIRSTRTLVNVPPRVAGLTVDGRAPGSPQIAHISGTAPLLAWAFEDNNSADPAQVAYNVSVWSETPAVLLWQNQSTTASSVPYAGSPLEPGRSYRVEVRVSDGRLWSAPSIAVFRRNTPPAIPILLDPLDLATDVPTAATLSWEALTDPEGDSIRYFSWVGDNPGFSGAFENVSFASAITVSLAGGTEYFWKVGASDGYQFTSGNATVWRFTTVSPGAPVLGDIRGRVIDGTTSLPLAEAYVELLSGTRFLDGNFTGTDGAFAFEDVILGSYVVRVRAFGFVPRTVSAVPTRASPSVNLGDIVLAAAGGPDGGGGGPVNLSWLPIVLAIIGGFTLFGLIAFRRRGRQDERPSTAQASKSVQSPKRAPSVTATSELLDTSSPASRSSSPVMPKPVEHKPPIAPPKTEALFECPICSRLVAADATRCACGALFDA